ncbi:MAG: gephyrin-like molybdotransferase Glp [Desulfobacterales bacterium]|nr:gephyrin-like molybdotransferase Glp [Desulfobacterales bacterium]
METFFKVTDLESVLALRRTFPVAATEEVALGEAVGRVLAEAVRSDVDLPDFRRATMDGYAVQGASTFGASEGNPAYLSLCGAVPMGQDPDFAVGPGEAARIATGGMLPAGADSVIMIEHTEAVDDALIEAYRSVAPGQNMVEVGEDVARGQEILSPGRLIRPQEAGLLAAFGRGRVSVFRRPVVAIVSTGDEVVPVDQVPGPGRIRDINTYTLAGLVASAGGVALPLGIVRDDPQDLRTKCVLALAQADMVLISGGSSVGTRDFTIEVLSGLPAAEILVHGIAISPGKPTILARVGQKPFWGLPGHVVSAMVVFEVVVRPFIEHQAGVAGGLRPQRRLPARLTRNLASAQGRTEFVRVRLIEQNGELWAQPVLGKSGLIHTMVQADGLVRIGQNTEGLEKGSPVAVLPFQ